MDPGEAPKHTTAERLVDGVVVSEAEGSSSVGEKAHTTTEIVAEPAAAVVAAEAAIGTTVRRLSAAFAVAVNSTARGEATMGFRGDSWMQKTHPDWVWALMVSAVVAARAVSLPVAAERWAQKVASAFLLDPLDSLAPTSDSPRRSALAS